MDSSVYVFDCRASKIDIFVTVESRSVFVRRLSSKPSTVTITRLYCRIDLLRKHLLASLDREGVAYFVASFGLSP